MAPPTRWTVAITGVFGVWLLCAPFILGAPVAHQWNDVIVGGGILVVAGYNYSQVRTPGMLSRRASAVNGLLGGWLLVAPFVFEVSGLHLLNDITVGIGVVSFAMYNIYAAPRVHGVKVRAHPEET